MPGTYRARYFKNTPQIRELVSGFSSDVRKFYSELSTKIQKLPGDFAAANSRFARKLHTEGSIYTIYAISDSISLGYSFINYLFSVYLADHAELITQMMREFVESPLGLALAILELTFIISFAYLANLYDKKKNKTRIQTFIAEAWPYFRDAIKAIKNALKGLRISIVIASILTGIELSSIILPTVLAFGGVSLINRLWHRYMLDERKEMMRSNATILAKIKKLGASPEECLKLSKQVRSQTKTIKKLALLSSGFAGLIDGPYLYMGLLSLAVLPFPLLIYGAAVTVFCLALCVAFRLYEEFIYQQKVEISKLEISLETQKVVNRQKVTELLEKLTKLKHRLSESQDLEDSILHEEERKLAIELIKTLKPMIQTRSKWQSLVSQSKTSALLMGIKIGLTTYGVLAAMVFTISTFLSLASIAFPPTLVLATISLSIVFLAGFIGYYLVDYYKYRDQQNLASAPGLQLDSAVNKLNSISTTNVEELYDISNSLYENLTVEPKEQPRIEEALENARAGWSGTGKVCKVVTYLPTDYDATSAGLLTIALAASVANGAILLLRADAKGFGRPPLTEVDLTQLPNEDVPKIDEPRSNISSTATIKPTGLKRIYSSDLFSFFRKPHTPIHGKPPIDPLTKAHSM